MGSDGNVEDGGEESGKGRKEQSVQFWGGKGLRGTTLKHLETILGHQPGKRALALALPINMLCDLGDINQFV